MNIGDRVKCIGTFGELRKDHVRGFEITQGCCFDIVDNPYGVIVGDPWAGVGWYDNVHGLYLFVQFDCYRDDSIAPSFAIDRCFIELVSDKKQLKLIV